ncbi:MAG: TatD family hydrolase [Candidatus Margulisiibacteriota bacterium]|jgi:TatD DNase family protein
MLIDTHAHLNFPDFAAEPISKLMERAAMNDVQYVINVGTDLETSLASVELSIQHADIYATAGVHPQDAHVVTESDIEKLYELAKSSEKVVAIGEIGLDYYNLHNTKEKQQEIFRKMLFIAKALDLPYIVHNREAAEDVLRLIKESGYFRGVMHCFGGDIKLAEEVLAMGLKVSFTGLVTYKNAKDVQEAVSYVPLNSMMLETDAPFLAPVPYRGKRNEPAYILDIAKKIAELKGESLDKVKEATTANALNFFHLRAYC